MALYNEYVYDEQDKKNCWYKSICHSDLCEPDENHFCVRHYKMHYLVSKSLLEGKERFTNTLTPDMRDVEAYRKLADIRSNIEKFVVDGNNLLIYSQNCGNGKTEWSKKLLLSWFNSIWHKTPFKCRGMFLFMPIFISSSKDSLSKTNEYYNYVMENIYDCDLVVWDEINYKNWTDYEAELLFNIISQRIAKGKSNIFTTNYDLNTITNKLGPRLSSRIIGSSELIEFKGADRRADKKVKSGDK